MLNAAEELKFSFYLVLNVNQYTWLVACAVLDGLLKEKNQLRDENYVSIRFNKTLPKSFFVQYNLFFFHFNDTDITSQDIQPNT